MSITNPRPGPYGDRRRSQRVLLSVQVRIAGTDASGVAFTEDTTTAVVNVHGGLVLLKSAVRQGQRLKMKNLNTDEETQCVAIDANAGSIAAREVGVEFVAAAPRFWGVSFRPVDWSSRSPEAKRFGRAGPAQEPAPPQSAKTSSTPNSPRWHLASRDLTTAGTRNLHWNISVWVLLSFAFITTSYSAEPGSWNGQPCHLRRQFQKFWAWGTIPLKSRRLSLQKF